MAAIELLKRSYHESRSSLRAEQTDRPLSVPEKGPDRQDKCGGMGHIARECKLYRKTLCKMGFGPPKELNDPDDIEEHFAAAIKLAPLQCFHCLGEGHMKPQCPLLKSDGSNQPKQNGPQGRVNESEHLYG